MKKTEIQEAVKKALSEGKIMTSDKMALDLFKNAESATGNPSLAKLAKEIGMTKAGIMARMKDGRVSAAAVMNATTGDLNDTDLKALIKKLGGSMNESRRLTTDKIRSIAEMMKRIDENMQTAGATEPEGLLDKELQASKDFIDAHEVETPDEVDIDSVIMKNSEEIQSSLKRSPPRWNDQMVGEN